MGTFTLLASLPFVTLAALYFAIKNLKPEHQDWIISCARFRIR